MDPQPGSKDERTDSPFPVSGAEAQAASQIMLTEYTALRTEVDGQEPAEDDAAELVEHAGQRAAGDAAQRWSRNPWGGRAGRADRPGQDGPSRAGAPHSTVLPAPASPPGVHT